MSNITCRKIPKKQVNDAKFQHRNVGCLILSKGNQYILQKRDKDSPRYPGYIALFGGEIEKKEQAFDALVRELKEELDIIVPHLEVITLGIVSEPETKYSNIEYLYFWHDKEGIVNHCYEGKLFFTNDLTHLKTQQKVMNDVLWAVEKRLEITD